MPQPVKFGLNVDPHARGLRIAERKNLADLARA